MGRIFRQTISNAEEFELEEQRKKYEGRSRTLNIAGGALIGIGVGIGLGTYFLGRHNRGLGEALKGLGKALGKKTNQVNQQVTVSKIAEDFISHEVPEEAYKSYLLDEDDITRAYREVLDEAEEEVVVGKASRVQIEEVISAKSNQIVQENEIFEKAINNAEEAINKPKILKGIEQPWITTDIFKHINTLKNKNQKIAIGITHFGDVEQQGNAVGLAREFYKRYPEAMEVLEEKLKQDGNIPHVLWQDENITFFSVPVAKALSKGNDLSIIETSIKHITDMKKQYGWNKVLLPTMGVYKSSKYGNSNVSWEQVHQLLSKYADEDFVVFTNKPEHLGIKK